MTLYISILVILLSLFLILNNFSNNKNSIYICSTLIIMALNSLSHHFTIISPNRFWIAIFFGNIIPLAYLIGPFLFFYTRNYLKNSFKLNKIDYLHFIPFIVSLISILPYYFTDFDTKLRIAQLIIEKSSYLLKINFSWLYPSKINLLLRPIILVGYSLSCLLILYGHILKKKKKLLVNKQKKIILKWLLLINSIMFLLSISYTYFTVIFYYNPNLPIREISATSTLSYILLLLFFLIPILLLAFPEILYGLEKIKINTKSKTVLYKEDYNLSENITELILVIVKKEENLLNPNFGIEEISKTLGIDKQEVLYCFNVILKTKYITLRKELRVDLAKKEINNGKLVSHSMEGIWIKSGFSSKTSFFVAFKKVTGMTPLQYSKSLKK